MPFLSSVTGNNVKKLNNSTFSLLCNTVDGQQNIYIKIKIYVANSKHLLALNVVLSSAAQTGD